MSALTDVQDGKKYDVTMLEEHVLDHLPQQDADTFEAMGHLANQEDHEETAKQALRRYPWTFLWMVYGIWIILCCAFDNSAGGSVVGLPKFREDYGYAFEGNYVIPANWQSAWSGGPNAAQFFGTFATGCESWLTRSMGFHGLSN